MPFNHAPQFTDKLKLYSELLSRLQPDDPDRTETIARATRFGLHEAIVRDDAELLNRATEHVGVLVTATTLVGNDDFAITSDYTFHYGTTQFPQISFEGAEHILFAVDPAGQPLFDLHAKIAPWQHQEQTLILGARELVQ